MRSITSAKARSSVTGTPWISAWVSSAGSVANTVDARPRPRPVDKLSNNERIRIIIRVPCSRGLGTPILRRLFQCKWRQCNTAVAPAVRVDRLAVVADLEVQAGAIVAAGVAGQGNDVAGRDPLANFAHQALVVAVQGQVTIAMV